MRINKYIALKANFSRRKADELIKNGKVKINDKIAQLGDQVDEKDRIVINGKKLEAKKFVYLAYNKQAGIVSSSPHFGQKSIVQVLRYHTRIHPVGRLDKDSTGLILLTNDPRLTEEVLKWEKEYEVEVDRPINEKFLEEMKNGIKIFIPSRSIISAKVKTPYRTKPAKIKRIAKKEFSIIIHEGKKRQIRLMCQALGYNVRTLKRIRIGKIELRNLAPGKYKELKYSELKSKKTKSQQHKALSHKK